MPRGTQAGDDSSNQLIGPVAKLSTAKKEAKKPAKKKVATRKVTKKRK